MRGLIRVTCGIALLLSGDAIGSVGFQNFDVVSTQPIGTQIFSSVGAMSLPGPEAGHGATVAWSVGVDLALLNTFPAKLTVNIPDRGVTTLSQVRSERRGGGNYMWMGRNHECSAFFDVFTDGVKGTISCIDGQYGIDHAQGSPEVRLTRYDGPGMSADDDTNATPSSDAPISPIAAYEMLAGTGDTTVDVLVAFNGTMTNTNIWSIAQTCIDQTQLAMVNSTSPGSTEPVAQLRLAGAARVSRTVVDDPTGDVAFIENNPEGIALHAYWAADVVVMVSPGSGTVLGYGEIPGYGRPYPGPDFAPYAVAAVLAGPATSVGDYVFAHELAHTFGANHNADHGTPNPTPVAPYAFAKWGKNPEADPYGVHTGYRTIMSYVDECTGTPCPRLLNYSNPDVTYVWFTTGLEETADNARVIREVAQIQAQNYADIGRIFADGFQ